MTPAHVAWHGQDGHALAAQGVAHRRIGHLRQLVGRGDGPAEDDRGREVRVVVDFLDVVGAEFGEWYLPGDRQDGLLATS
ncbi:hypothetical protein ACFZCU_42415 [Streptomyces canus]|uniref:hypothetical protein n=1 Tax=Streptomyces canus TaxID=58343 RepID=UPI0036E73BD4